MKKVYRKNMAADDKYRLQLYLTKEEIKKIDSAADDSGLNIQNHIRKCLGLNYDNYISPRELVKKAITKNINVFTLGDLVGSWDNLDKNNISRDFSRYVETHPESGIIYSGTKDKVTKSKIYLVNEQ